MHIPSAYRALFPLILPGIQEASLVPASPFTYWLKSMPTLPSVKKASAEIEELSPTAVTRSREPTQSSVQTDQVVTKWPLVAVTCQGSWASPVLGVPSAWST